MPVDPALIALGFSDHWIDDLAQLSNGEFLARIATIQRGHAQLWSATAEHRLETALYPKPHDLAVGDWMVLRDEDGICLPIRRLPRHGLVSRRAAGDRADQQLIAANLNTLFIVSSCNTDFSLERLERYLVVALEAEVEPVIVLTKADECADIQNYVEAATGLRAGMSVLAVNALDGSAIPVLEPWCGQGQTIALVGSSGVGKSTLINALCAAPVQDTQLAREGDDKGRHTTTARSLHRLRAGGLIIDTPGMRELQLPQCAAGVEALFDDISPLLGQCRFNDCAHIQEPGCAILAALSEGVLDERRWNSYQKLQSEQAVNAQKISDRNATQKQLSKTYKAVQQQARKRKNK